MIAKTMFKKFAAVLIFLLALPVVLGGCSAETANSKGGETFDDEVFNPQLIFPKTDEATDQTSDSSLGQPVFDKKDRQEFVSHDPGFSFQTLTLMTVKKIDRQQYEKTGEVGFVGISYDLENENVYGHDYWQQKPFMSITVYEADDPDKSDELINYLSQGQEVEKVIIGDNEFFKFEELGLSESVSYIARTSNYLYYFLLVNYPANYQDQSVSDLVNESFLEVLKTFKID